MYMCLPTYLYDFTINFIGEANCGALQPHQTVIRTSRGEKEEGVLLLCTKFHAYICGHFSLLQWHRYVAITEE